jgi:hypothetical protein
VLKKRIAVLVVVFGIAAGATSATGAGAAVATKAATMSPAGASDGSE